MRLTKRLSLTITRELWAWLAETGSRHKGDWAGWEKYDKMASDCALCEYSERREDKEREFKECQFCPLLRQWDGQEGCLDEGSPYLFWLSAKTPEERKRYAQRIVELCDIALAELKE
jgi:hypothetical protein